MVKNPPHTKSQTIPNLRAKAKKLGFEVPTNSVWIIPTSFEQMKDSSDILYDADYDLVIKLFRTNSIPYSLLEKDNKRYPKLVNHSFEFFTIPIIVFTIELLRENPDIITMSLNVLERFLKKRLHRQLNVDRGTIKTSVIKEIKPHRFRKYNYEGNLEGYKVFVKFVQDDKDD